MAVGLSVCLVWVVGRLVCVCGWLTPAVGQVREETCVCSSLLWAVSCLEVTSGGVGRRVAAGIEAGWVC